MISEKLMEIYRLLYGRFGPQHWWPGQTRFEVIVGAILTQNTNWGNVEKAIANLNSEGLLSAPALNDLPVEKLALLIRPAGYYNIKAARLKNFLNWLFENFGGSVDALAELSAYTLRERLLAVKGIGAETADSIILYAFDKPVFVVDSYTGRILGRHGLIEPGADYEQVKELFQSALPSDTGLFNEYHALLVRLGREYCRSKPICTGCPLESLQHNLEWHCF